jgi:gliding motility-associated-like protein
MLRILFTFICLSFVAETNAQDKSNRGKEFWLAYGFDYSFFNEIPVNEQELAIYISTEQAATVSVTITNTGYLQTLNIPANTVNATILIPKSGPNDARTLTDGLQNRGIHIVSDVPVAVYAHVYATMVSGATMLMPVETYGYAYYSINYYQNTSQSSPADWYSWFYAIATEDNTRLEITPSDTTKNGWLPGITYTVNLNKGESFHVFGKAVFNNNPLFASKDMTGSKVISVPGSDGNCHPVAVFSGSGGIRLCRGDGGEFMHQQVFPSQAWGTRYLTYHTINNTTTNINETNRNYYRVCVSDPSAVVKKNGLVMTGLIKNFFYEYMDSTGGDYIESNKPILVSQYMTNKNQCWNFPTSSPAPPSYGDPEMFYISPIEQGQKAVLFYTSRKSGIDYVYANIHLPTSAVGSLRVDGNVVPAVNIIPHPNLPSYSVALTRFIGPAAQHRISCDSAFTSTVYGLGNYESYGYNVGTLINNLNNYSAIENTNNTNGLTDTFTCKNTPVRLFVKLAYPALTIHWKLSQVPGMTPNVDSVISNPVPVGTELINGRTYYVYTLHQDFAFTTAGTYYLPVSYTAAVIQNCSQTENASVKIVVKPNPVADFTWSNSLCMKDTIQFTGTSVPGIFNFTGYNWFFDDATTDNSQHTVKSFLTPGNHPVHYQVIAGNGCVGDTIKTVVIWENPIARFGVAGSVCLGDSVYITDTSSVASGTITSWRWDFGDGNTDVRTNGNPFYHTYTTPGNYLVSLVVISSNGCKSDTLFRTINTITQTYSLGPDQVLCSGNSVLLNVGAPSSTNTFLWQDGSTSPNFLATVSGLYWVQVTNSSGCSSRDSINLSFAPAPFFNLGIDSSLCSGDALLLNATVTSATSYLWSTGATTATIQVSTAGIFWCEVSIGACIFRDSLVITSIRPKPIVNFGNDLSLCNGNSVTLDATNPNCTYLWQDGAVNPTYSATTTGLYWVEATHNLGCKKRDSINIIFSPAPFFNLGIDSSLCSGDTILLNATVANASGYLWSTGATTATIKVNTVGIFWCEVNIGTCTFRDSLTIISIRPSPGVNLGNDVSLCSGNSVNLNATNANSTYLWQDGSTNPIYTVTTTGLYWVEATHNLGCKKRDSINIAFTPLPIFNLGVDSAICVGDSLMLNASVANATAYLWSTGATTPTIKVNSVGIFWCEVSIGSCTFRDSLSVTSIKPRPVVNLGNDKTLCEGITLNLDANYFNSTYLWQDGSTSAVFTVSQQGIYIVKVNYNGCTQADTVQISYILKPRFTVGPDQFICQGIPIILSPLLDPQWLLRWQDGSVNPVFTVTQPGLYSLTATNNCGSTLNEILVEKGLCKVFVPNAFTPNGDGKNDFFKALGTEAVTTFNLKIFNRYGQIVFETNDKLKGWDGKLFGQASPAGGYVYFLTYKDNNAEEFKMMKGSFILIR